MMQIAPRVSMGSSVDPLHRNRALASLLQAARRARTDVAPVGAAVITLDNHCVNDCGYCPFARSNRRIHRFRIAPDRLFADAESLALAGYQWLILQMGQAPALRLLRWRDAFAALRQRAPSLRLMVGAGEQTEATMRLLATAGVDAYAISLECADESLFSSLRPVGLHARRRFAVRSVMLSGLRVASGLTVGLPGETEDQLADSVAEVVNLAPDIVLVNVYQPCAFARLSDAPAPDEAIVTRVIASLRLALSDRLVLAGCPTPTASPMNASIFLDAGADGAFVNVDSSATFPRPVAVR